MVFQLKVNGPRGEEKIIDLCNTEEQMKNITVMQLKKKIVRELVIIDDIRMVYGTEQLEEMSLLSSYGIQHLSTIHTLLVLPGGVGYGPHAG
ncbi:ubiquitin-60S ribosomal protein L40-like protein [Lates japonicus]|uniref:Ubiquitin-60S ribosomal protein L40-like protein n=1 Tax=Lates japonicus TaxID=270547 RepID=A0AAD3R3P1_LATJO|nr:ubiquitin-60S ribosomal protein L40-like protein [Lates japonicus]